MADFFSGGGGSVNQGGSQSGSSSGTTRTTFTPGPFEAALESFYQPAVQGYLEALGPNGGMAQFARPWQTYAPMSSTQNDLSSMIAGLPGQGRYTPQMTQGMDTIQGLMGATPDSRIIQTLQQLLSTDPQAINTVRQLLGGAMGGPTSLETQGLNTLQSRTDPTALRSAAEEYMAGIVTPSATAAAQAGGLGGQRGGALQEMLAKYGSAMALPIAQMVQQAQGEYGGAQIGVGSNLASRQAGLATLLEQIRSGQSQEQSGIARVLEQIRQGRTAEQSGLASQLAGISMQDIRPGQMQLLQQAFQNASVPQMLSIQDMMRKQNLAASILPRAAINPGGTTTVETSQQSSGVNQAQQGQQTDFTLGSLLGPLSGIAAAGLMAPAGTIPGLVSGLGSVISGVGSGVGAAANWLGNLWGSGGGDAISGGIGTSDILRDTVGSVPDYMNWI